MRALVFNPKLQSKQFVDVLMRDGGPAEWKRLESTLAIVYVTQAKYLQLCDVVKL